MIGGDDGAGYIGRQAINVDQHISLALVQCDGIRHSRSAAADGRCWSDGDVSIVGSGDYGELGAVHDVHILVREDDVLSTGAAGWQAEISIGREPGQSKSINGNGSSGSDVDAFALDEGGSCQHGLDRNDNGSQGSRGD